MTTVTVSKSSATFVQYLLQSALDLRSTDPYAFLDVAPQAMRAAVTELGIPRGLGLDLDTALAHVSAMVGAL